MTARPKIARQTIDTSEQIGNELHDTPASQIHPEKVQWFWVNRLPAPTVTILQGEKESGKSTWCRLLASIVTAGGKLPGEKKPTKFRGSVLWYAGEESLKTRVRPGLEAFGADLDKCFLADLRGDDVESMLALPNDCERLQKRISLRGARLVIIDPVFAFSDGTCDLEGPTEPARRFMRELDRVATSTGALILLTRNLTKDSSKGALAAGRGSGELGNAARAVLHTQAIPGQPGNYALAVAACNEGPKVPSLTYRLATAGHVQKIEIVGTNDLSADELIAGDEGDCERSSFDQAVALIRAMLPAGKLLSTVVKKKGEDAMIHPRTMQKAAKHLKVQISRKGSRDTTLTYWSPPKGGYAPE